MENIIKFLGKLLLALIMANAVVYAENIRPVPWLTEGAIEFLEQYLTEHPSAKILEFGTGASTIWFAKRTPNLYSIEHDPSWFTLINVSCEFFLSNEQGMFR